MTQWLKNDMHKMSDLKITQHIENFENEMKEIFPISKWVLTHKSIQGRKISMQAFFFFPPIL
jgi:hypothetical protein